MQQQVGVPQAETQVRSQAPGGGNGNVEELLPAGGGSGGGGVAEEDGFGGSEEPDRGGFGGGNRWPRQETLALLKIRSEMDAAFRDATVKGPLWDDVSRFFLSLLLLSN